MKKKTISSLIEDLCTARSNCLIVARSYANGLSLFSTLFQNTKYIAERTRNRVVLVNGSTITLVSAQDDASIRGRAADIVLIDGASRFKDDIIKALIPLTFPNGIMYTYYGDRLTELDVDDLSLMLNIHAKTQKQSGEEEVDLQVLNRKIVELYANKDKSATETLTIEVYLEMASSLLEEVTKISLRKFTKREVEAAKRKLEGLFEFLKEVPLTFPRRKELTDVLLICDDKLNRLHV